MTMSILLRLKNKLQDPSLYETKIREFDECMLLLKNENAELNKRIDQLETLYKTGINRPQTQFLEEYIRQLEDENGRLTLENQCQREEYERFLERLTPMVLKTAVMQENIREECASIFHVIERLSTITANTIEDKYSFPTDAQRIRAQCVSLENLKTIDRDDRLQFQTIDDGNVSSVNSFTTPENWTLDSSSDDKEMKISPPLPSCEPTAGEEQQLLPLATALQRSETFIVSRPLSPLPTTDRLTHSSPTRTVSMIASPPTRPSKLPSRRSTCSSSTSTTIQSSTNRRFSSTQKESKLPIRTSNGSLKQPIPIQKLNTSKTMFTKTRKDFSIASTRPSAQASSATTSKSIPTTSLISSRPVSTVHYRLPNVPISSKHPTLTTECVSPTEKSSTYLEQRSSTSSESSIEEQPLQQQQQADSRLTNLQDEGYSTWSSTDVKDDITIQNVKLQENMEKSQAIGLVRSWLHTSEKQHLEMPMKELEMESVSDFNQEPCISPIVRNRSSVSLSAMPTASSDDGSSSSSSSSSTFSCSETFERVLLSETLPHITNDLNDSISSASSAFNMSEYIEDKFMDHDDPLSDRSSSSSSSTYSSSIEPIPLVKHRFLQPEKRLLFPGLLNRLIFLRRVVSDSNLKDKDYCINENVNLSHVYHSNTINEHSVEVNLINTYGSESELHVWSLDCAEQRRFVQERHQPVSYQHEDTCQNQQLALERQMLLQQIYEYPWLLQENDLDQGNTSCLQHDEPPLFSPSSDVIVPSPNPDFYQLCSLTHSSSFATSHTTDMLHTAASKTPSVL